MKSLLEPPGSPAEHADLRTTLGRSLADVLQNGILPFVDLREVRRDPMADVVVVSIVPALPQDPVADIRRPEHIAIRVRDSEDRTPEVFALRKDFPRNGLHLNVSDPGSPWASLCLYDEGWQDIRLHLTPASLLAQVQEWLSRSARGDLHLPEQPVEPFVIPSAITLVLPPSLVTDTASAPFRIESRGSDGQIVLVAAEADGRRPPGHLAFAYRTRPTTQTTLRQHPADLEGLDAMLQPLGFELVQTLRSTLRDLKNSHQDFDVAAHEWRPVLVFAVPLLREDGAAPERDQVFSYSVDTTVLELGRALGIWDVISGTVGLVLSPDDSARGQGLRLLPLRPVFDLTPEMARSLSGFRGGDLSLGAIGVGALGSQVVMNLARSGFCRWVVVDNDSLLPHNLVRHALPRSAIGFPKAETTGLFAESITSQGMEVRSLVADVLEGDPKVDNALRQVDAVLDMSATATVARALAQDREGFPRCISLFLNPMGTDLVALVEDGERRIRLDALEMQYYRALLRDPRLDGHLTDPLGRLRYGTSCRDVTMQIPQEQIAVAAGIGARAVRMFTTNPDAGIRVWRMDAELAVNAASTDVFPTREWGCGDWTVVADEWLLEHLAEMRHDRLPSETGGILVGFHDMQRHRIYIAEALAAPPDSTERPVYFDRGCVGLRAHLAEIQRVTNGALSYVGEWHSHPGTSTRPSTQDGQVLEFLSTHMAMDGHPGLMVIVGQDDAAVFVDSTEPCVPNGAC